MNQYFTIRHFSKLFLFVISSLLTNIAQAQITVTFRVVNKNNESIPFASVYIRSATNSTTTQRVADSTGTALFSLAYGQYTVQASALNYIVLNKTITVNNDRRDFILILQSQVNSLKSIEITASKPVMRQEDDKTIVDPENLAASSTSAYEIIEKTPGLFVDQDGNIYLSSTTPATIYINGREQKMSAADIASMLKSLPPNSISGIEIMRTPSARYDASGSGGIINVILRKGVKIGLMGSINAGLSQGREGNRFIGLNVNNNNGNTTSYFNLQYTNRNTSEEIKTDRLFAPDSLLSQDAYSLYPANNYYLGFGFNFLAGKKWEVSYDGRINFNDFKNTTSNISQIKRISTNGLITDNTSDVRNDGHSFNISQGVSTKYKIDTAGSEWSSDISYNSSPGRSGQAYSNTFSVPVIPAWGGNGKIHTGLNSFSVQTNLLYKLPKKWTVESGLKSGFVSFNTSRDYVVQSGSTTTKDPARTGAYNYKENINSAYAQVSKSIGGFILKAGARLENTNMEGHQIVPSDTSFKVQRTDLFPYIYLSKKIITIAGYDLRGYLVYRRTITRPDYQLLNPSQRYVDQYLYETGNPLLRPQFTRNYEVNISVDDTPLFAVGINETKDIFTSVVYSDKGDRRISYRTSDNLGNNKEMYFRVLGAIPPGGKIFIVAGAQYNHNFYNGLYEQKPLSFKKGSWSLFTYQTLRIAPDTQFSLNGFLRFRGQLQFYELSNFGTLNVSLNQQLLKKKLTISMSMNDIFLTNNNDFVLKQGNVNASGFRKGDTRRFGLNLRYNFGFAKKEEKDIFNIQMPENNN